MSYNFLFISVDDLCSIDSQVSKLIPGYDLPNLRRLKNVGTNFRRSYCPVPICGPSRASIMSNLSPVETGVISNTYHWWDAGLRPEHMMNYTFKSAGYFVGNAGKVFHGYGPQEPWIHNVIYDTPHRYVDSWLPPQETRVNMGGRLGWAYTGDETKFYDHVMASRFVKFVGEYKQDRPWLYEVGFYKPHTDYDAPMRIYESLDWRRVVMPEEWKNGWDSAQFVNQNVVQGLFGEKSTHPKDWTTEDYEYWQKSVRNYAASALWMDEQLGRLLDALWASPFAENTVISLISDHGYHLGDNGHWHKFTLYEAAARTPHIIAVPGQPPREVWSPVSHLDIWATLQDYAGITPLAAQRGRSQRSWIDTGTGVTDRPVPTFWFGSASVGYKDYRATIYSDGTYELFNVIEDPWLVHDLAKTHPDAAAIRNVLFDTMHDWGWSVVDHGETVRTGSYGRTFIGDADQADLSARHTVAFGNLRPKGRTPYIQKVWCGSAERGDPKAEHTWRLPEGPDDLVITEWTHLDRVTMHGNSGDNKIVMDDWTWGTKIFHLGQGNNEITGNNLPRGTVKIYAGSGNNILRSNANWPSEVHMGHGNDTLSVTGNGGHTVWANDGTNVIQTGQGNDHINTGNGDNTINTGAGNDYILVSGGSNTVNPGPGKNTIKINRTAKLQRITNLHQGENTIDLSDWVGLPLTWSSDNPECHHLRAIDEHVIFSNIDIDKLKNSIKGI